MDIRVIYTGRILKAEQFDLFAPRKPREPVKEPGSRGGKYWVDEHGRVRYDERPQLPPPDDAIEVPPTRITQGTNVGWANIREWLQGLDTIQGRRISSKVYRQLEDHVKALDRSAIMRETDVYGLRRAFDLLKYGNLTVGKPHGSRSETDPIVQRKNWIQNRLQELLPGVQFPAPPAIERATWRGRLTGIGMSGLRAAATHALPPPPERLALPPPATPRQVPAWELDTREYQARSGVHMPWIGEISGEQRGRMSGAGLRRYDAQRSREWSASASVANSWHKQVLAAFEAGTINYNTPGLSHDAKSVILSAEREAKEAATQQAKRIVGDENEIRSPSELAIGDRVFSPFFGHGYGIVAKVHKHSARLRDPDYERHLADTKEANAKVGVYGEAHLPRDTWLVEIRHLRWLSPEDADKAIAEGRPIRPVREVVSRERSPVDDPHLANVDRQIESKTKRLAELDTTTAHDAGMAAQFPTGVGGSGWSPARQKAHMRALDSTINRATESVQLRRDLDRLELHRKLYAEGKIDKQGRRRDPQAETLRTDLLRLESMLARGKMKQKGQPPSEDDRPYTDEETRMLRAMIKEHTAKLRRLERATLLVPEPPPPRPAHELEATTLHDAGGMTAETDPADERIHVTFARRLTKDEYSTMRRYGWLWSPKRSAFVRNLNAAGHAAVENIKREFAGTTFERVK